MKDEIKETLERLSRAVDKASVGECAKAEEQDENGASNTGSFRDSEIPATRTTSKIAGKRRRDNRRTLPPAS